MRESEALRKKIRLLVEEYQEAVGNETAALDVDRLEVPVSGKVIGCAEICNMVDASLDGWLTTGRFNKAFEKRLTEFVGVKHALTVNSGSSANLVAFSSLTSPQLGEKRIKKGDEVITVAAGFPTTINPIIQFGAIPVFVDVDLVTHNIDVSMLEEALTDKTRAVMIAHSLGNPFDLDAVTEFCKLHELWLVEDCCDALGSTFKGRKVGTFGDIATLSFYPAHHITMGEGGAVLTNNGKLKKIAESFRDWGRDCFCPTGKDNTCGKRFCWTRDQLGGDLPDGYDHKYTYSHLGYNLKITDMQAACALAQMDRLVGFIEDRKRNFTLLYGLLESYTDVLQLPKATEGADPSWFGFPITLKDGCCFSRRDLVGYLNDRGVGTRLLFAGNVVKQPYMGGQSYRVVGSLANTDKIMNSTFWVGVFPGLDERHLDYLAQVIGEFLSLGGPSQNRGSLL